VLYWNPILGTPVSHDFEVGESLNFALFELGTTETWSNGDDTIEEQIFVIFDFSSPEVENTANGQTQGSAFLFLELG
jgi:hypothetical protein